MVKDKYRNVILEDSMIGRLTGSCFQTRMDCGSLLCAASHQKQIYQLTEKKPNKDKFKIAQNFALLTYSVGSIMKILKRCGEISHC